MAATSRKKQRRRPIPCPPPRTCSARLYLRINTRDIALFRFLLEANDNLALFTVVDRTASVLLLRFSPDQEREVLDFLEEAKTQMDLETVLAPN